METTQMSKPNYKMIVSPSLIFSGKRREGSPVLFDVSRAKVAETLRLHRRYRSKLTKVERSSTGYCCTMGEAFIRFEAIA
jgi:hypothetical protein